MATGLFASSPSAASLDSILAAVPYCGVAATPDDLWQRWNLDPWLIAAFGGVALAYLVHARRTPGPIDSRRSTWFALGWAVALLALISPLCAWAVALFSVRVGQHMILTLVAAPLLALGFPSARARPWLAGLAFLLALWLWHYPPVYAWSLRSDLVYWVMQISLIGASVALWQAVFATDSRQGERIAVGIASTVHMGLLGALLTFASRPFYQAHWGSTEVWGLSALADQQLAGLLMWVPGGVAFGALGLAAFLGWWRRADASQALQAGSISTGKPITTVATSATP
ncbi:cytochrome c oxidase assembly protein [Pigmentiphaga aceris]|uniref:Cytochrome c oxidase assembly protein n=1 Tax=Pigmentiphaga aceris TaxID=1940612 RepID=A0A5C0AW48_9BURK|nr:cytochrome c oxidase assembly protein [Pigmentiphaga aceris]QEI04921.1 cytochrome c oxidase assembly protein [Pigmentiphaga aceris]